MLLGLLQEVKRKETEVRWKVDPFILLHEEASRRRTVWLQCQTVGHSIGVVEFERIVNRREGG